MSARARPAAVPRVFLLASAPASLPQMTLLRDRLARLAAARVEPVLLAPETGEALGAPAGGREMREGDLLVLLRDGPIPPQAPVERLLQRAAARRLGTIAVRRIDDVEEPALQAWYEEALDPADDPLRHAARLECFIMERLGLWSVETDLFGTWPEDEPTDSAWELLGRVGDDRTESNPLARAAHECREQAAQAIAIRLFEPALRALDQALLYDRDDAVSAYWRARLLAATSHRTQLVAAAGAIYEALHRVRQRPGNDALRRACHALAARLAAQRQDRATLLAEIGELNLEETCPPAEVTLAARWLFTGGERAQAVALLQTLIDRTPGAEEAIARHPLLDALLPDLVRTTTPAPAPTPSHWGALARLLEAERSLLSAVPKPPREDAIIAHARAFDEWSPETPPVVLAEACQRCLSRQLELLEDWAERLLAEAIDWNATRHFRRSLKGATGDLPAANALDHLLWRVWPRLRQRRQAFERTLSHAQSDLERLQTGEGEQVRSLRAGATAFLEWVVRFETLACSVPEILETLVHAEGPDGPSLRLASAEELQAQGLPHDDALLPDPLAELVAAPPSPPGPRLYRLEAGPDRVTLASRAGVYWGKAYDRNALKTS